MDKSDNILKITKKITKISKKSLKFRKSQKSLTLSLPFFKIAKKNPLFQGLTPAMGIAAPLFFLLSIDRMVSFNKQFLTYRVNQKLASRHPWFQDSVSLHPDLFFNLAKDQIRSAKRISRLEDTMVLNNPTKILLPNNNESKR